MLTALVKNRSLTYFQPAILRFQDQKTSHSGGIASVAIAQTSMVTGTTTTGFNSQLNGFLEKLNALRAADAQRLDLTKTNKNARNTGVKRAWEYEKADVEMGGDGSADWNKQEQQEILEHGKIRQKTMPDGSKDGPEGHHQKNAADNPEHQADPDNIKFFKDKDTHRKEGHGGDTGNPTDGPMTDKNAMLKRTNFRRVFKNELRGVGIAVAIGLGVGMTIGFVVSLAQSGVSPESLRLAAIDGAKGGLEAGLLAGVGYGVGRTIGAIASRAASGVLANMGLAITDNIAKMVNMGVVGGLTIIVFSAYQFVKLKLKGAATRDALMQVGKQALFSLSLLAVSIVAQGIWGGHVGIIVSVSIGIIFVSYSAIESIHQRRFGEKVRVYMIDKCRPVL